MEFTIHLSSFTTSVITNATFTYIHIIMKQEKTQITQLWNFNYLLDHVHRRGFFLEFNYPFFGAQRPAHNSYHWLILYYVVSIDLQPPN